MRHLFKCIFLIYMIAEITINNRVTYIQIFAVLILVISNIVREKYLNSIFLITFEFLVTTWALKYDPNFSVVYGILTYDLIYRKMYLGVIPMLVSGVYFLNKYYISELMFIMGLCSLFSYLHLQLQSKNEFLKNRYDVERKYRYELEQAKAKLLNSSKDVAHIAEIKERNRIARDIHDNIGHSIAGVLMQLQASYKLFQKNDERAKDLLKKSIDDLADSLNILRDTVHNIKPTENIGIDYIKQIIDNFSFCPVDFKYNGDFSKLDALNMEILATNVKEALTNASKYSQATKVEISININDKFIRLYIKDNGVGSAKIKENLGINGMRERIKNAGGSISISGEDGFMIVCIIPVNKEEGGAIFEGSHS